MHKKQQQQKNSGVRKTQYFHIMNFNKTVYNKTDINTFAVQVVLSPLNDHMKRLSLVPVEKVLEK